MDGPQCNAAVVSEPWVGGCVPVAGAFQGFLTGELDAHCNFQDPEAFVEDGGWSFLDMAQSDSEDEDGEQESDFEPRSVPAIAGVDGAGGGTDGAAWVAPANCMLTS